MKLHILNDLHIEFDDFEPPQTDSDVVVLAGDIGVGTQGLDWAAETFTDKQVIYVCGNHEFYKNDLNLIYELKEIAPDHIHVLNNDQVVIDGVRFLGCTLWTDFALFGEADKFFAMQEAERAMPDFSIVKLDGKRFSPKDAIKQFSQSKQWLEQTLAVSFDGLTVVVTHHAPSSGSVHPRFTHDLLSPAFASHLEYLMGKDRVSLWIHGHMHDPFDYDVYGTRIICNPRGYAPDQLTPGFKPDLIVDL